VKGFGQALACLRRDRPDVIFSKGGFVSVPVVLAASVLRIPCILHESDLTPGLANKLCFRSASRICCNFPETLQYLPADKAVLSGTPIRQELFEGSRSEGLAFCGFSGEKPVLLVMGGSLGADSVNKAVRAHLQELLEVFDIVHLCGRGKVDASLEGTAGYRQFPYVSEELPHVFAAADTVVSRAGANAICELLALRKPHVLVPLPTAGSRGDQLLNAASFEKRGFSRVVRDEDMDRQLVDAVKDVFEHRGAYAAVMAQAPDSSAVDVIMGLIEELAGPAGRA
jgi:UDP-N-acetylglucosamine--N-acetylmuramyl-(pentapeptide) pyrophosphoryl-undecaprenol N-acetylglucosamine transferase